MTEESIDAIQVIEATIRNCQKSQLKFVAGSAQFTLLKNRLYALEVGRDLLNGHTDITVEALVEAQAPIESIIHKTEKALSNQKNITRDKTNDSIISSDDCRADCYYKPTICKKDPSLIWGLFCVPPDWNYSNLTKNVL